MWWSIWQLCDDQFAIMWWLSWRQCDNELDDKVINNQFDDEFDDNLMINLTTMWWSIWRQCDDQFDDNLMIKLSIFQDKELHELHKTIEELQQQGAQLGLGNVKMFSRRS